MAKFATGKYAKAISDRSGLEFPYKEMVREWNGSLVHVSEFEPKQPQLEPKPMNGDSISLRNVRPARTENAVPYLLPTDAFETYSAGSRVINVTAPGHGLTNGTTYRFRGPPLAITASGGTSQFGNPESFDGISGSNIAKAAGYAITTGLYVNDARVSTDYAVANFFHFTVDTDTATKGGVSGGGNGCSVGPVTLSA
jgi:hypothetical protein|tara:strand:- start:780 stop:1370 length:591 start_codon:yes stop_codon:yes gene_type:complete